MLSAGNICRIAEPYLFSITSIISPLHIQYWRWQEDQPPPCKSIPLVLLYLLRFVVFSLPFQLCLVYLVYIVLFRPLVYFGSICFGENIQAQTQFSPWISSYCPRCSIVHIIVINITMCTNPQFNIHFTLV